MIPNFAFVIPGKLAGGAHPGHGDFLRQTLRELVDKHRITAIVSLTHEPLDPHTLGEFSIRSCHLPVVDFGTPSLDALTETVAFARETMDRGGCVMVHCSAGYGRTGTVLACCLVAAGKTPDQAIQTVRRLRPGSIETGKQERLVYRWAERWERTHQAEEDTPSSGES